MNFEQALEHAETFEGERHEVYGPSDKDGFPSCPGSFTPLGPYVVYSYLSQGIILTEIWTKEGLIESVKATLKAASAQPRADYDLWVEWRPVGVSG